MSSSATLEFWQLLLIALGPAALTTAVAIFSPLIGEKGKEASERRRRRAEKYEELIGVIYEHRHWLTQTTHAKIFGKDGGDEMNPMVKIVAITNMYFPKFSKQVDELDTNATGFVSWALDAAQKRLNKEKNYTDGHNEAWRPYAGKFHNIMTELKTFAQKEFQ